MLTQHTHFLRLLTVHTNITHKPPELPKHITPPTQASVASPASLLAIVIGLVMAWHTLLAAIEILRLLIAWAALLMIPS